MPVPEDIASTVTCGGNSTVRRMQLLLRTRISRDQFCWAGTKPADAVRASRDLALKDIRARILGSCDIGMFTGGATGIALGGIMSQSFGWRTAFFFVGIPGLLLGLSAMRLPEPPRDQTEEHMQLRELLHVPAYLAVLVAVLVQQFRRLHLHCVGAGPYSGTERLHGTGGWIGIGAHRGFGRRVGNRSRSVFVRPHRALAAVGPRAKYPNRFHAGRARHLLLASHCRKNSISLLLRAGRIFHELVPRPADCLYPRSGAT